MIRALIVDDEAPARERMRSLLAGWPVEVAGEASDGHEAVDRAATLSPDVVFLDIQMPGLSGLDVAARLRAPRPRIVFTTAFDQFALEAFEHQAIDYLVKPVSRERLGRVLGRLVEDVESGRRARRERQEAADVQAKLMPSGASRGGLDYAAQCLPASGVGGDYFDVLPVGEGRTAFSVGDVSGKGLYAGILAAAVQGRMQSICASEGSDPAATLAQLNDLSINGLEPHRFITLALAIYDPLSATLHYAAAGHPPALLLRERGTDQHLEATGPVIGWPEPAFTSSRLDVRGGDLLALYTDGVTESTNPDGQELGPGGLAAILRRHAARPTGDLVRATLDDLATFAAGAPAADDRTLLVSRFP